MSAATSTTATKRERWGNSRFQHATSQHVSTPYNAHRTSRPTTLNSCDMVQANTPRTSARTRFEFVRYSTKRARPYEPNRPDIRTNRPISTSLPPNLLKIHAIGASRANCAYKWPKDPGFHSQPPEHFPSMSAREVW